MKMKIKHIIALLAISLVIFAGCKSEPKPSTTVVDDQKDTPAESVDVEDTEKVERDGASNLDDSILENRELDLSNQDEIRDLSDEAVTSDDISKCDLITDENQKNSCKYNIVLKEAMEKDDESICDKIGNKDFTSLCKQNFIELPTP